MLYIFDLGNVIVDIDFNRVLGAWSDLTRVPLATRIYQHVVRAEGFSPDDTVFFDDNADNIEGANRLGITSILVKDKTTIPDYFAKVLC